MDLLVLLVLGNDTTFNSRKTLDLDRGDGALEELETFVDANTLVLV